MSMMKVQSTSDESLAENMEINFKSLSLGNGSSGSSDQVVPCLAQQDQSDELSATKDQSVDDGNDVAEPAVMLEEPQEDIISDSNLNAPGLSVSREVLLRQIIEAGNDYFSNNNLSFHHQNPSSSHTSPSSPASALNPNAAAYYPLRSTQSWALLCCTNNNEAAAYFPWFLSPWNYGHVQGSSGWNIGFIPSGHSNYYYLGPNPYFSDSLIFHTAHHHRSLELPYTTSQYVEASTERVLRLNSEFCQVVIGAHHMGHLLLAQPQFLVIDAHHMEILPNQPLVIYSGYYPHLIIFGFSLFYIGLEANQMSYEDLLLLGEQIGSVETGLSEETIKELLKRKHYQCDITDPPSDAEMCCICIGEYVQGEEIGVLNCGHEFHTECIKSWLVIKNDCPMCKRTGLDA